MTDMYAPNQQAVRGDSSGPAEQGDGGTPPVNPVAEDEPTAEPQAEANPLDVMTKDELIEEASERGLDVNVAMTKAEIRAVIDAG